MRSRGTAAKVHLALSGPLQLAGSDGRLDEAIRIGGGHVDDLERAFDAIKYRRFSERPHLEIRVPTVADPSLAPPGHHVVSILASYAPYDLEGGWNDAKREAFGETVISTIERYAPNFRSCIVDKQIITPKDIERIAGITGGNIFHGELLLHQIFFLRPTPQWADFRTPLKGYYFGAAGAHPGGGVMGAAGMLAAKEILKDGN